MATILYVTGPNVNVDLDTARVEYFHVHSSHLRERAGKPADLLQARLMVDAIEADGRVWPCMLNVKETKAVSAKVVEQAKVMLNTYLMTDLHCLRQQAA